MADTPLTPEVESDLRAARAQGESWGSAYSAELIDRLLATLDAARQPARLPSENAGSPSEGLREAAEADARAHPCSHTADDQPEGCTVRHALRAALARQPDTDDR